MRRTRSGPPSSLTSPSPFSILPASGLNAVPSLLPLFAFRLLYHLFDAIFLRHCTLSCLADDATWKWAGLRHASSYHERRPPRRTSTSYMFGKLFGNSQSTGSSNELADVPPQPSASSSALSSDAAEAAAAEQARQHELDRPRRTLAEELALQDALYPDAKDVPTCMQLL